MRGQTKWGLAQAFDPADITNEAGAPFLRILAKGRVLRSLHLRSYDSCSGDGIRGQTGLALFHQPAGAPHLGAHFSRPLREVGKASTTSDRETREPASEAAAHREWSSRVQRRVAQVSISPISPMKWVPRSFAFFAKGRVLRSLHLRSYDSCSESLSAFSSHSEACGDICASDRLYFSDLLDS